MLIVVTSHSELIFQILIEVITGESCRFDEIPAGGFFRVNPTACATTQFYDPNNADFFRGF